MPFSLSPAVSVSISVWGFDESESLGALGQETLSFK